MLDIESDDTPHAPCADALVAGTVALMTAWAAPCPTCTLDVEQQRYLLTRKVMSNLLLLQQHPALSLGLRQVMAQAHLRWGDVARTSSANMQVGHPPQHPFPLDDERSDTASPPAAALH